MTGKIRNRRTIIIAVISTVVVFGLYVLHFNRYVDFSLVLNLSEKNEVWGSFGDFIGGTLNPTFSFLALIALLRTITLQSEELSETRKELSRAADAHENSKEIMALQSNILKQQQFEGTFFKLLEMHEKRLNILNSCPIGFNSTSLETIYRHTFQVAKDRAAAELYLNNSPLVSLNQLNEYSSMLKELLNFITNHFPNESCKLNVMDKGNYSDIIRASLPLNLLEILFIKFDVSSIGGFNSLLTEYKFFAVLDREFKITYS